MQEGKINKQYSPKKIDVVGTVVNTLTKTSLNFHEIISSKVIVGQKKDIKGKKISMTILEEGDNFIIGFIQAEVNKNIPPKINGITNEISALDIRDDEYLAYGNIFLYDFKHDLLFYEVNSNSVYLDGFKDFIHSFNDTDDKYEVRFSTIYKKDQYQRAMNMDVYKKFKVLVRQPSLFIEALKRENAMIEDKIELEFLSEIETAAEYKSDSSEIKFDVSKPKTMGGLAKEKIMDFLQVFNSKISKNSLNQYVDRVEVVGYSEESDRSLTRLNLIGDVYFLKIKLEVFKVGVDLQKGERLEQIKDVYEKNIKELLEYL